MAGKEEEFSGLWSRRLNSTSGGSDPMGVDPPRQSEHTLLRLQTQLSCSSQSGEAEPGGGGSYSQHPSGLSLGDSEQPPRRTASLPTPSPSQWVAGLQSQQAFQLGGYWGKSPFGRDMISGAASGQVSSLTDPNSPSSTIAGLGSRSGSGTYSGGFHSSRLQPTLSLSSQPEEDEEQTADLASMLRLSQSTPQETPPREGGGDHISRLAAGLLRHHSAPSSILGNSLKVGGGGGGRSVMRPPGHPLSLAGQGGGGLGPLSAVTSAEEQSPTESVTLRRDRVSEALSLSHLNRRESLREGAPPALALRRSDSVLSDPLTLSDSMRFESLQLGSPSSAYVARERERERERELEEVGAGVVATIDFSNQLGALNRGESRKRSGGFDLTEEPSDSQGRKRAKSPDDSEQERVEESVQASEQEGRPAGTGATSLLKVDYGELSPDTAVLCKARAKRGCATHPRSIAERVRRTRISENMRKLQDLVPHIDKQANTADMLEEAVEYMKFLAAKVEEITGGSSNLEHEFAMRRGELNSPRYQSSSPPVGGQSRNEAESSDL